MKLFLEEETLLESDTKEIILTTHRIRQDRSYGGLKTIMLEQVSSIEIGYQRKFWLAIVGIVLILASIGLILENEGAPGLLALVIGIGCIAYSYYSRKNIVSIGTSSTKLVFQTKGMSKDKVKEFAETIEAAIEERVRKVYK